MVPWRHVGSKSISWWWVVGALKRHQCLLSENCPDNIHVKQRLDFTSEVFHEWLQRVTEQPSVNVSSLYVLMARHRGNMWHQWLYDWAELPVDPRRSSDLSNRTPEAKSSGNKGRSPSKLSRGRFNDLGCVDELSRVLEEVLEEVLEWLLTAEASVYCGGEHMRPTANQKWDCLVAMALVWGEVRCLFPR